jgi:hypothetical protein
MFNGRDFDVNDGTYTFSQLVLARERPRPDEHRYDKMSFMDSSRRAAHGRTTTSR